MKEAVASAGKLAAGESPLCVREPAAVGHGDRGVSQKPAQANYKPDPEVEAARLQAWYEDRLKSLREAEVDWEQGARRDDAAQQGGMGQAARR